MPCWQHWPPREEGLRSFSPLSRFFFQLCVACEERGRKGEKHEGGEGGERSFAHLGPIAVGGGGGGAAD